MDQVEVIMQCMENFCKGSGQRINHCKSQVLFSKNTDEHLVGDIVTKLGISRTMDLGRYLGVPSIHGRVTSSTFSGLIDRIEGRLEGWKTKFLSLAGRHTLAQSVLSVIPTYTMQTALLPKGVCMRIEQSIHSFIWGRSDGVRRCSLVN